MSERTIFLAAIEIADSAERAAFVNQACGADDVLRAQVEQLLRAHEQTSRFLETPVAVADAAFPETVLSGASSAEEDPGADTSTGEEEFCRYLEPGTRADGLGRLGHYEIEEILGRGAFGIVAKGFDGKLHRTVAIKMLSSELATTSPPRKRFLREARTAAAVEHENIVGIHAVEESPIPYLVMEYLPGETLQQRLNRTGPLDVPDVLRIGQQIASGLAAAHAVNLIHRDIKPSNIMLGEGLGDRVKISDFGLARSVDDASLTSSGLIAGTPMYMAPEQARGEMLDHRTDLFSLGSVLYQMVSGRPPFRAANTVAVLKRVCEDTPRAIQDIIPGTPDWLCSIIFRLLEKDPDDRYQTAKEVADILAQCQRELQHSGEITCVPDQADLGATRVAATTAPDQKVARMTRARRWRSLAALVVIAFIIAGALWKSVEDDLAIRKSTPADVGPTESDSDTLLTSTDSPPWLGLPADAPPPAIAPFDAVQARRHQQAWAEYLAVPVIYENSVGMKMVLIPPGEFMMGTSAQVEKRLLDESESIQDWLVMEQIPTETPQHRVRISRPFFLGQYEVTQAQWNVLSGKGPAQTRDEPNHPVTSVSWEDAQAMLGRLNDMTDQIGLKFALPTEAEWEYACRAGSQTLWHTGDDASFLKECAWIGPNRHTNPVGQFPPNGFGLYDMHGNVWEWCADSYQTAFYSRSPSMDPWNRAATSDCVLRGGCFNNSALHSRSATRFHYTRSRTADSFGFRVKGELPDSGDQ
jgi:eukaryotic-like serine/threonine-protein kinase